MDEQVKAAATPMASLRRKAFSLGAANAFDYAMQFLLPVLLVRFLSPTDFGQYRLLWLLIMTAMVVVPLSMPQSLYYFLPRSQPAERRLYINQTVLYLAAAGLVGGLAMGPWNPLLPAEMHILGQYGVLLPAMVTLFAVTFLLDMLPTIEERVHWQAAMTITLSLMRTLTLGCAAWLTGSLSVLIDLLMALMLFKLLLLLAYIGRMHGLAGPWFNRQAFIGQFHHAAPLGISSGLYGLRAQADQWVVAKMFALENFAVFSIAAVLGPMVNLCRQSVNHVFLPTMSRLQAAGDMTGMVGLNSRANVMVATLVYPLLAIAFAFAEEIITLIYTHSYADAAPIMRIYVAGLVIFVVELSSLLLLLREGAFAWRLNLAALVASIAISWIGAVKFGLVGGALGSTVVLYGDRISTLRRLSVATGIPLRQLQDWPALASLLAFAAVAGLVAWSLVGAYLPHAGVFARLAVGMFLVAAVYGGLWWLSQLAHARLPLTRDHRTQP